ncbi:MAG: xanthosine permease [Candidatus Binatia bacterium]|nr:MAG: xanthosine permease [Candidatus Binatia bacterium]
MRALVHLSTYWFFLFAAMGVFFPYYSLYLRETAGLGGTQIGLVLATLPLVGIATQPLWGIWADRTGARRGVVALLAAGSAVCLGILSLARGFWEILLATGALALFFASLVPLSYSLTLAFLAGRGPRAFGYVRVWGTVGFLLLAVGFPRFSAGLSLSTAHAGSSTAPGLEALFWVAAALLGVASFVATRLPSVPELSLRARPGEWRLLLRHPAMRRLFLFVLLAYFCLQGPMVLLPIYVTSRGGDMATVGDLWLLMLLVEIPLVLFSGLGLERIGARGLLAVGVAFGGARWFVCGLAESWTLVYAVQLFHGLVVAGLLLGGPLYVEAVAPPELRASGQALLSTVGVSLGGILSNTTSGVLLDVRGIDLPYVAGGLGALVLGLSARFFLPRPER